LVLSPNLLFAWATVTI